MHAHQFFSTAGSMQNYSDLVLSHLPDLYFPLNEDKKPAVDLVGGVSTIVSGVTFGSDLLVRKGGTSATFASNKADYISVDTAIPSAFQTPDASNHTIEMWIRPDETFTGSMSSRLLGIYPASHKSLHPIYIFNSSGNYVGYQVGYGVSQRIGRYSSAGSVPAGQVHHLCFTWDASARIIGVFVNGAAVQNDQGNSGNGYGSYFSKIDIGRLQDNSTASYSYAGDMGHVAFYSRVLTTAEIAAHYAAGRL
jgi:hypothetical protein